MTDNFTNGKKGYAFAAPPKAVKDKPQRFRNMADFNE